MESPRLNQEDKLVVQPEVAEDRQELTNSETNIQETKEPKDSNSHDVKDRINVENSQMSTQHNIESHELSETTKSDRKSTDEVEESSSQPAQLEKNEENNVESTKNNENMSTNEPNTKEKQIEAFPENQEQPQAEEISNKDEVYKNEFETESQINNPTEEIKPEDAENNEKDVKPKEAIESKNQEGANSNETEDLEIKTQENANLNKENIIENKTEEEETNKSEVEQNNEKEIPSVQEVKIEAANELKAEEINEMKVEESANNNETKTIENKNQVENNEKTELQNTETNNVEENQNTNESQPIVESNSEILTGETNALENNQNINENLPVVQNDQVKKSEILSKENQENAPSSPNQGAKDRSPKIKGLRIQTQQPQDKIQIITLNTEVDTNLEETTKEEEINQNNDSPPSVVKHYLHTNLSDLIKPDSLDDKSPSNAPVKRMASATGLVKSNRLGSTDEENKETQQPQSATQPKSGRLTMEDFHKITSIGRGSYGEVFLVKKISNNKLYALKAIDKNFMKKEKKEHQVYVEREVLMKLNHPNIIKLFSSFQDKMKLYFVLEYVSGGEFSDYLRIQGKLSKEQIVFFAAEIVNILEYLHNFGIAHRDMKPENLLLTPEGHIKCIDFGTARFLATEKRTAELYNLKKREEPLEVSESQKRNHRSTFVGTAQYVSPEMLEGSDCGAPADLWALGCMIYLMAVGKFPFMDINEYLIFQKIKTTTVVYPEDMDLEIKDIIQKLLVKEPLERLGAGKKGSGNDYETLKKHSLFRNINFDKIHEQKPPVVEIASPHKRKSHDPDPNNLSAGTNQQGRKHCHSEDLTKTDQKANNKVFDFQSDKVRVILSGLVLKKCGWLFFKPRQLILNSKPRLVYYDPDSNQLKGEIPLAPTTKAELESKTKFLVKTPNRTFVFKEMEHSAEKWVEIINTAVQQLYSKKN